MRHQSSGLTLLEVLCATALSTLLMVGLLGVIAGIAKTEKTLISRSPTPDWERRILERLERDLGAAELLETIPEGFRLTGSLGSDPQSGVSTWTEATVDYLLADSPLGPVFLRRETAVTIGAEPCHEVIAYQVAQLIVTPPEEPLLVGMANGLANDTKTIVTLPAGPPPAAFRFVLLDSRGNVTLDRLVTRP